MGDEINVTIRVVIRRENGERYEYSRKLRDRDLNPKRGWWSQNARTLLNQATDLVAKAIQFEHGTPHDTL